MHAKYKRFVVSSVLVFLSFTFVGFTLHRTSEAENLPSPPSSRKQIAPNVVPDNTAKMNFVRGGRVPADDSAANLQRSGVDVSKARPLSLASGDLNADGFPDLVCGYEVPGGGLVVIHYGDERAYAPTDSADVQAVLQNQFRAPFRRSTSISLDHAPEFLFTGDFDRDTRRDILTAARGGSYFTVLAAKGDGFDPARIDLSEQVTSVAVAEGYSADGFADVYVGTADGQLLGFEDFESIVEQQPEVYQLPGPVESITVGRFDQDPAAHLGVIANGQVYIVHGEGSPTERIDLPFSARALAAGDFIWDRNSQMELAVAGENGTTAILSRGELDTRPLTSNELEGRRQYVADIRDGRRQASALSRTKKIAPWRMTNETFANPGATSLIPMLASGQQSIDLLSMHSDKSELSISYRTDGLTSNTGAVTRDSVSFPTDNEPVAVLPMRLNIHSRPSLVVFEKGSIEPSLFFVTPEATFPVTKTADTNDGACNADCSLREAVIAANTAGGLDMITFAIDGNFQLMLAGDDNTSALGDLDVNSDITFVGNGQASTFIQGSSSAAFTGNMGDKAIGINQDGTFSTLNVTLQNLTVRFTRNDIAPNAGFTQTGGAMDIFLTGTGLVPGPTTTLTNVTFDSNASEQSYGGALNIDSGDLAAGTNIFRGTVNIAGSTFSNNDTLTTNVADNPPTGGAINMFADRHDVTISNSSITGNQTSALITANGGGINIRHSFGGTVTLTTDTISTNTSGSDGGGILTAFNQTVNMTGGSLNGNTAQGTGDSGTGGGLFNSSNLSTTLANVTVINNIATAGTAGSGGGIADGANGPLSINGCTITSNQADNGGGIAVVSSGGTQTATVSNSSSMSGNTATNGSAAHVSSGVLAFANTNAVSGNIDVVTNPTAVLTGNTGSTTNLTGNLTLGNGAINVNNSTFNITGNFTQSGGAFNGNSGTVNLTGNFSYTGGTFNGNTGTFNFNGSGAQSISATSLITFNNLSDANVTQPLTFNNSINVNGFLSANGANTILNPVAGAVIGGTGTLTGTGTARVTRATGTNDFLTQYTITNKTLTNLLIDYVGAAAQGISGTTYTNVRLNNSAGGTLSAPATVNGTLSLASGTFNVGSSTLTLNNGVTVTGGSLASGATGTVIYNQGSDGQSVLAINYGNLTFSNFNKILPAATVSIAGTFNPGTALGHTVTGSTINFNGTAAQSIPAFPYNSLMLNNAAGASLAANVIIPGTLTLTNGVFNVGTNTLTLNNGVTVGAGSLASAATGTVIYNQASDGQQVVAGIYGNLTFSNFNKILPAATVGIAGTFIPGTATGHTISGNTIDFNGAGLQAIPAFNYNNLTSSSTGARTLSNTGIIGIAGVFTPGTNVYTITGSTIDFNGSGPQAIPQFNFNNLTSSNVGSRTLVNGGTIGIAGVFTPGTNVYTVVGNTINFNGSGAQTIPAFNYNNLTSSNVGARTLSSTGTIGITVAFTPGTNVYTIVGSTVEFNGVSLQTLPASFTTYHNLTANNPAGLNLAGNVTINGILTFLGGNINTGANTLTVAAGGSSNRTSGHLLGNLMKIFASTGPFTYHVGTPGEFSPVAVVVTAGAGQLSVMANDGPAPATPPLSANSLQRYWTLNGAGITADVTFNYLQSDVVGIEQLFRTVRVTGGTATILPNQSPCPGAGQVCVDHAANTIFVGGLTSFSDWSATQVAPTAGEVVISGRVLTQTGRGISGLRLVLRDAEGNTLSATTNTFGFYRFENVPSGETYILTPLHRQYRFTPRVLTVGDNMEDVNFVPDP